MAGTSRAAPSRLRQITARGAVVNLGFSAFGQLLTGVQAVLVPRLLGPSDIGLFTIAMGGVGIGVTLKNFDLPRKLIQERDTDIYTSYSVAFTLELLLAGSLLLVVLGIAPLLAYFYHEPRLWLLASVLGTSIFSTAFLDLPAALPAREMRFVRWNLLLLVAPVVSFAVTVPAAMLGAGVWSLGAGTLAGTFASAVVLAVQSPIGPHLFWDRALVRRYLSFGWPLWLGGLLAMAAGWGTVITVSAVLGVTSLGFFQLAQNWAALSLQVDGVLSDTVFPALCTMQSSLERLRRAFVITNRLSMLWASPVAFGILLFAEPAVRLLLGPKWHPALILVQAESAGVICTAIAYNWQLFFAARGQTRPQLTVSLMGVAWLVLVVIPLLVVLGLDGAAASIVVLGVGTYAIRSFYVRRLLGPISLIGVLWREICVGAVAAAVIAGARLAGWQPRSLAAAILQGIAYLLVVGAGAGAFSRGLVLDTVTALRRRNSSTGPVEEISGPGSRTFATPRRAAFPLLIAHDPSCEAVWVTLRDWSALGRYNPSGDEWRWIQLPPYPHSPAPDGEGGCWTALTRSSAVAHIDRTGGVRLVQLEKTRELLITAVAAGAAWVVDSARNRLWRIDVSDLEVTAITLPPALRRADFVTVDTNGLLWIADTQSPNLVRLDPKNGRLDLLEGPHPTRSMLADPDGRGLWLGGSDRPILTLIDENGAQVSAIDLTEIPFGLASAPDGRVVAALKSSDAITVVTPSTRDVECIPLPPGSMPMGCAVAGGTCWATLAGCSEIISLPMPRAKWPASSRSHRAPIRAVTELSETIPVSDEKEK